MSRVSIHKTTGMDMSRRMKLVIPEACSRDLGELPNGKVQRHHRADKDPVSCSQPPGALFGVICVRFVRSDRAWRCVVHVCVPFLWCNRVL